MWKMHPYFLARVLSAGLFFIGTAAADTIPYTGMGGLFTVPTSDNPAATTTTFVIPVTDSAIVAPGDSVSVTLTGLHYPYAADLQVSLSFSGVSRDLFNQIGIVNSGDPGYGAQFAGTYTFDSSSTGDLWNSAAGLGSTDTILDGSYWTTSVGSNANDNLSSIFLGLPIDGTWVLTVIDYNPPFGGIPSYSPGITSWDLTIQTAATAVVPEPSTALYLFMSLILVTGKRAKSLRSRPQ
jgi:hypothetical protein